MQMSKLYSRADIDALKEHGCGFSVVTLCPGESAEMLLSEKCKVFANCHPDRTTYWIIDIPASGIIAQAAYFSTAPIVDVLVQRDTLRHVVRIHRLD